MENSQIERQLEELFEFEQHLHLLLENEQYEELQQQQAIFAATIKTLLDSNSAETLNAVVSKLKQLETNIATLKNRSENSFKQLKEKSLLQKRNKNRVNAYK